jgi:hypothetical protein
MDGGKAMTPEFWEYLITGCDGAVIRFVGKQDRHEAEKELEGDPLVLSFRANQCFGRLDGKDQEWIFDWIDEGPPNIEKRLAAWAEYTGRPVTEADRRVFTRQWKRNQLALFRDHLDAAKRKNYETLVQELGGSPAS